MRVVLLVSGFALVGWLACYAVGLFGCLIYLGFDVCFELSLQDFG